MPVWLEMRAYDGTNIDIENDTSPSLHIYGTEEIVAPICEGCRQRSVEMDPVVSRVTTSGPCVGCGRLVHVTPKALKSWLGHGKRICCCDDCSQRTMEPDVRAERPDKVS
jgi:hypothetical protein